jgi:hypothetical protein
MGRLKKYQTPEEKKAANLIAAKAYYWRNKEARDNQSRINYKNRKDGSNLRPLQED